MACRPSGVSRGRLDGSGARPMARRKAGGGPPELPGARFTVPGRGRATWHLASFSPDLRPARPIPPRRELLARSVRTVVCVTDAPPSRTSCGNSGRPLGPVPTSVTAAPIWAAREVPGEGGLTEPPVVSGSHRLPTPSPARRLHCLRATARTDAGQQRARHHHPERIAKGQRGAAGEVVEPARLAPSPLTQHRTARVARAVGLRRVGRALKVGE